VSVPSLQRSCRPPPRASQQGGGGFTLLFNPLYPRIQSSNERVLAQRDRYPTTIDDLAAMQAGVLWR
jgi:hypothetical protein